MTRFLDGPLAGRALLLNRAPLYLRATIAPDGSHDALDQLDDQPHAGERLIAYRRRGGFQAVHVQYARKRGGRRCAWLVRADYRVVADQPPDATMRDAQSWQQWCRDRQQAERDDQQLAEQADQQEGQA